MNVTELARLLNAKIVTSGKSQNMEITCGYACDLLSWVMAHGCAGMAWITVQTHMNVIAVASLMELSAVIVPEGVEMEQPSLDKAREEGVTVLSSDKTAYELCACLARAGLPGTAREG